MARKIPGGEWLEPADVGFNAAVIAAAGNLNGPIIPWIVARPIRRIVIVARETGSTGITLRSNDEFDFNGTTSLRGTGASGIWNAITSGAMHLSSGNPSLPSQTVGTAGASIAFLFSSPYIQFNVLNNDGVNPATVTMRIGLFE